MSILSFVLGKAPVFAMLAGERYFFPDNAEMKLQPLFALVIVTNVIGSTFTLIQLGMKVGKAREKYGCALPEMYATDKDAEGKLTENARKFNCVQRGHQQALETYPSFLALSFLGGIQFPISTAIMGALWIVARQSWAEGYASGDPNKRYGAALAKHVWTPLIVLAMASLSTSVELLLPLVKKMI